MYFIDESLIATSNSFRHTFSNVSKSITSLLIIDGIKLAPIPWILCGPKYPFVINGDE